MLVVASAAVGSTLLYAGVGTLVGDTAAGQVGLLPLLATATVYDLLLAPFVVPLVMWLARRTERAPITSDASGVGSMGRGDKGAYGWLSSGTGLQVGGVGSGLFGKGRNAAQCATPATERPSGWASSGAACWTGRGGRASPGRSRGSSGCEQPSGDRTHSPREHPAHRHPDPGHVAAAHARRTPVVSPGPQRRRVPEGGSGQPRPAGRPAGHPRRHPRLARRADRRQRDAPGRLRLPHRADEDGRQAARRCSPGWPRSST